MDRISALRNVEEALAAFEAGEIDLSTAERRVQAVLRTYATEFADGERTVYRVECRDRPPVVVVATSRAAARVRARESVGEELMAVAVEPLER